MAIRFAEIPGMLCSQNIHFTALCESFKGVGADGLEHPKARLAVGSFFLSQEAVIYQRCKTFENIELAILDCTPLRRLRV